MPLLLFGSERFFSCIACLGCGFQKIIITFEMWNKALIIIHNHSTALYSWTLPRFSLDYRDNKALKEKLDFHFELLWQWSEYYCYKGQIKATTVYQRTKQHICFGQKSLFSKKYKHESKMSFPRDGTMDCMLFNVYL